MLFGVDLHEHLINEERVAVSLMISLQSPSKFPAEIHAAQAN
jgi:hypothetical protein